MDLITYVKDISAMIVEGKSIASMDEHPLKKLFTVDDEGLLTFNVSKVPVKHTKDGKSVCLCRGVSRELIGKTNSIEVLGECINNRYIFDSDEAKAKYESVYNTKAIMIDDGEGGKIEYTPPYMIGVFA